MRQDDHEKKCYFRSSDRVFHMNGAWFFATREGDQGPFPSEACAQDEIDRFITEKTELAHFQKAREAERARNGPRAGQKLELVALDERPVLRKPVYKPVQRKVHI
ncbi:MAG: DUF6316 family protein [bacterium]